MYKFKSYKDEELEALQNSDLLPKGEYEFSVLEIAEKFSKAGNEMLEVKLHLSSGNETRTIRDWIVMMDSMAFKFKHFCEALGFLKEYEKGEIDLKALIGRHGKLLLDIQQGNPRPTGGYFPDRNFVQDYIKTEMSTELKEIFDKDIPF